MRARVCALRTARPSASTYLNALGGPSRRMPRSVGRLYRNSAAASVVLSSRASGCDARIASTRRPAPLPCPFPFVPVFAIESYDAATYRRVPLLLMGGHGAEAAAGGLCTIRLRSRVRSATRRVPTPESKKKRDDHSSLRIGPFRNQDQ